MGGGPLNLLDPRLGSLDASGKEARWVGGGEPEAAEMSDEGLEGTLGGGLVGRECEGEVGGEFENGLGVSRSSIFADDLHTASNVRTLHASMHGQQP